MGNISTPRVTCSYLNSYLGRNVLIVGKVMELRGDEAIVDADGNITVHLNREAHLSKGNGVQVIGKVNPDLSIKALTTLDLGTEVDFTLANTVVEISHQHPEVFHS
ncbi:single-stranded DNA binding protein 12k chain-like protein [Thermochaetoides thermophila DSM 1495]|uniref:Single-stranded DNA binding protein 12k chain-like protein n=1 Tax=Chaetomium thermophilum (strain DSM 1495 / CBS 144.50 / IMI 039719) TaxID=759272 RepID=G0S7U6_CHATD|nr:single-stranded DNA binding protein 12k chain-like protein [Thermochaetoides thermophila DSM 1495]EGS21046.1 single-stranded DNA binding protein 12k chain-like protein [Thermochaetoides thermophila DSM 1495]